VTANSRARRRPIPDSDLWQQLDRLLEQQSHVEVKWCKGHTGAVGSEMADTLARNAIYSGKEG
jgi:ribonuclease HI